MSLISRDAHSAKDLLNYRIGRLLGSAGLPVVRLCEGVYGISRREWGVLSILGDAGELSPSQVAAQITLDRPRTSRALQQLMRKGLVERRELPGDRRQARMRLSADGLRVYQELLPQVAQINRQLLSVLSEADLLALGDMLDRLTAQARQLRDENSGPKTRRYLGSAQRTRAAPDEAS